ncbi:MAG: glycosyltransferase [Rhodocyclaceae bacterium]|nr:glycosyltransferase [Rhodocyclaceae bacterium]
MRVLMPTDVYFPRINGVSTSIETFRASLRERNVDIVVVAPEYGPGPTEPGVVRVPARRVPMDPEDRLMRWRPLNRTLLDAARNPFDLIHVQTPFAAHYAGTSLARRLGLPVIATYHTHFEEYFHHYLPWLPRALLRMAARRLARVQCNSLDAVVVPSRAMENALRDYGVEAPLHVLPTGIPGGQFAAGNREGFRARYGIPARRPMALFVGRVAHEKNIGFLLEAMGHLRASTPELLLLVAGEGPALPSLRAMAHRLGLETQVRFVGYQDRHRDLADCYAAADVFVFASRTETQGLVLLEAMAAGLPVYALAEMGTRDILSPGRGSAIAPDDPASFAKGLADLLRDKPRLARLAADGPAYAAEWSADSRAGQMADLYRRITARR